MKLVNAVEVYICCGIITINSKLQNGEKHVCGLFSYRGHTFKGTIEPSLTFR